MTVNWGRLMYENCHLQRAVSFEPEPLSAKQPIVLLGKKRGGPTGKTSFSPPDLIGGPRGGGDR